MTHRSAPGAATDSALPKRTAAATHAPVSRLRERRLQHAFRAAVVGFMAGMLAVAFQMALFHCDLGRNHMVIILKEFGARGFAVAALSCAVLGSAAAWLTAKVAPEASGSGIPHVKAVLLQMKTMNWKRLLPVKFFGGLLALAAGFSLGREGPTVQMGAAAGGMAARLLKVPEKSRPQMISAGAGAGLAAAFNAPLSGFMFVIEELQREMSPVTYVTALVAAIIGDMVSRALLGQMPSFHISGYQTPPLSVLPFFAVLGVVTGLVGVLFNLTLLATTSFSRKLSRVPAGIKGAVAGSAAVFALWWLPEAATGGHNVAESILNGHYAHPSLIGFLVLLLASKFLLTMMCYGSGVPGGIFAPLLVLGAITGQIVGSSTVVLFPGLDAAPAAFAVIGMAAMFSAIVRAPLTGVVLIIEMTGNYEQIFPLLVACTIAYGVAELFHVKPIYEALLENDLERGQTQESPHGGPVLLDVIVEPDSQMDGCRIKDLAVPRGCLLVTVRRGWRDIVPSGNTRLRAGDRLTAIVAGDAPEACLILRERGRGQG